MTIILISYVAVCYTKGLSNFSLKPGTAGNFGAQTPDGIPWLNRGAPT